jgi:hypothetical protein
MDVIYVWYLKYYRLFLVDDKCNGIKCDVNARCDTMQGCTCKTGFVGDGKQCDGTNISTSCDRQKERKTDRQTDRQTDRHTDRQTYKQIANQRTDKQPERQIANQKDRQTGRHAGIRLVKTHGT